MKKQTIRIVGLLLIAALFICLLAGCGEGQSYSFLRAGNKGEWGGKGDNPFGGDYDDDDDDDDYGRDGERDYGEKDNKDNKGESDSSGNRNDVTDDGANYTDRDKFSYSLFGCDDGEAAISTNSSCTDENVVVPPTFTDYEGKTYRIVKDYQKGFEMLDAKTITLPEGFKEIRVGFSDCVNLKTIYLPSTVTKIDGYVLTNCIKLDKIVFNGTKAQWKAIELDDYWNYCAPALVIACTDGFIELQSWYESH